jgi:hypothetical protein
MHFRFSTVLLVRFTYPFIRLDTSSKDPSPVGFMSALELEQEEELRLSRWSIPKRTGMDAENIHISSFLLLKNCERDSIAFLKAVPKYQLHFKRGKLLLPSPILSFGEDP